MITKPALAQAILSNPSHTARVRVSVADAYGDLQVLEPSIAYSSDQTDVTISAEISEDVDTHPTAKVVLQRQDGAWSWAPGVTTGNPLAAAGPAIDVKRMIQIEVFVEGPDGGPEGAPVTLFYGPIDEVNWTTDQIEINASDWMIASCRDTFIEWERVYGLCTGGFATKGAYVWRDQADAKQLEVGDLVLPSKLNANGHFYRVTAKTSAQAVAEPTWPTGGGATVVSGGVTLTESGSTSTTGTAVETIMQQILNDNGLSWISLYTPSSPSWNVRPYKQQRESVLSALETLVEQLGWSLRVVYDNGTSALRLKFFVPPRSASSAVKTIAVDEEISIDDTSKSLGEIRNVVRVIYGDATTPDADGAPIRRLLEFSDAASITKYGRRFMEISEADASNIDTSSEATTLGQAALADLKDPIVSVAITIASDPYLQLDDLVTLQADGLHFSSNQTLAIAGIANSVDEKGATTKLRLRAAPSSGVLTWLGKDTRIAEQHDIIDTGIPYGNTVIGAIIGGARFAVSGNQVDAKRFAEHYEIHVSETNLFTPDSTTLKVSGPGRQFEVANLVPGKSYYQRFIPYTFNASKKIRGAPSVQQSFIAGRAKAGHYDSLVSQGHFPLNGNFEHATDDLEFAPFDHWNVTSGTWGPTGDMEHGTDATYGNVLSLRQTAGDPGLRSNAFPVRRAGGHFNIYLSVRPQGTLTATRRLKMYVRFYRKADLSDSPILFTYNVPHTVASPGSWAVHVVNSEFIGTLPSDVNFCTIAFGKEDLSSAYGWDIGDVFFCEAEQEDLWAHRLFAKGTIYGAGTTTGPTLYVPAWTAVTFENSFSDYNAATHQPCAYLKDSSGFVRLRGLFKRASAALLTNVFTLPSGYRPAKSTNFAAMANGKFARIEIDTSGQLRVVSADDAGWFGFVSIDGFNFDTR